MRNPLVPIAILFALVILVGEGFFGFFSRWLDPSRSPQHYSHRLEAPLLLTQENGDLVMQPRQQWMRMRLVTMPERRTNTVCCEAEVLEIADSALRCYPAKGRLLLYLKPSALQSMPNKGDIILALASPQRPDSAINPHQFDYRLYLRRKGILHTAYLPANSWRTIGHSNSPTDILHSVRQQLINVIQSSSLSPSQQGIAEALFLGWDNDLDPNTESNFRMAGITHLLCVSGLHVGIVTLLAGWLLFFLSNRRRDRFIRGLFQLIVTWLFVVITGMAPSTMRAGLMFSLMVVGRMFFSRPPTVNAIAASAVILLSANPLLLFNVGFQLSYSAVLAIVLFVRPLEEKIPLPSFEGKLFKPLRWLLQKARSMFCVSLVAQCATAPFILFYFHQFPLYFLVANMIVVPFAAFLLGTVMFMVALSWWPWAFKGVAYLLSALLSATEWVTATVASWPHALITGIWFDQWMLALAIVVVCLLGLLLLRGWRPALPAALTVAIVLLAYSRYDYSKKSSQLCFDVYDLGRSSTAIEFFAGHESYLLCDSVTASNIHSIDFQTNNNRLWHRVDSTTILSLDTTFENPYLLVDRRFVAFAGKSMRIVDRSNYRLRSGFKPRVDYLLLRESPYITVDELRRQYQFDSLIIASQNSWRRANAWKRAIELKEPRTL
ncbi:MAG: ComEC/Rec2 family competence protein [Bacteroidales bacterium]|nr:ComEC/Rec2 family competence protein [Bacteroidales bacterium]